MYNNIQQKRLASYRPINIHGDRGLLPYKVNGVVGRTEQNTSFFHNQPSLTSYLSISYYNMYVRGHRVSCVFATSCPSVGLL